MFTKTRRFKRYGESCGKTRRTGLLGKVHEINNRNEVMPDKPGASSFSWAFGSKQGSTFGEVARIASK